ncbi:hypothetical protein KKF81_00330 [Candidatus Micrarchaeota archaeon]|nr:hypothetical protein [Candidatus Micrarchaeota archaeon]MBU1165364.1 hypothetical protein [Candidatus Micrarchaeota archaeon]MBU1886237.1 hypothetical protein [Candidatus Micrarchaeota archaeon]
MKSPFPLLFLFALFLLIIAIFLLFDNHTAPEQNPNQNEADCIDEETKNCTVGDCNGTSTCKNGAWHGCSWDIVCTPGSTKTCNRNSCAYAYSKCNECGTGYDECE